MKSTHSPFLRFALPVVLALAWSIAPVHAGDAPTVTKQESFDRDPGWEGHNNHVKPTIIKPMQQDFGYRETNVAGKTKGEIGGVIWRAPTRAFYAAKLPTRTLNDKLTASGTFALTATSGSSGAFFGWFNSGMPGDGRQSNLGVHFAGQGEGARLTLRLVTATNQSCGTKVTDWQVPAKGEKYRPPSLKNDGTRYTWRLEYDPQANGGGGQMTFTMTSNSPKPHAFEGKTFTVPLPKGYKEHGTTFDRFGLMNTAKPGNSLTLHFDDLEVDGKAEDFSKDPGWVGVNNTFSAPNREWGGAHDFGFSADTGHAGGFKKGEVGGLMWRSGSFAYYADKVGPLSLEDRLEASGKVVLNVGMPDSGMYLGWFNSASKEFAPAQAGSFVGVHIGGPTKVGHYFLPAYATTKTTPIERVGVRQHPANVSVERGTGPVVAPQKVFEWKLVYDPAGGGKGTIEATLGKESITLVLRDGDKAKGANLDRFGLFTTHRGGSFVRVYFDDLKYTVRSGR